VKSKTESPIGVSTGMAIKLQITNADECDNVTLYNSPEHGVLGVNYKKILRLSYDVIITYDNRKSNLR